jgi:hypothetical protein
VAGATNSPVGTEATGTETVGMETVTATTTGTQEGGIPNTGNGTATVTGTVTAGTGTVTVTPGGTPSVLLLQVCGFCVQGVSHVLLTAPEAATFEVVLSQGATALPAPGIVCDSVEVVQGKQVLLCSGPAQVSFQLRVCNGGTCNDTRVNLPACPLSGQATGTATMTAAVTRTATPGGASTSTRTPSTGAAATSTSTPVVVLATSTPTP